MTRPLFSILACLGLLGCADAQNAAIPVYPVEVVKSYPHDPAAFTEGLLFQDGALFESTGLEGQSELREVDLNTGKVLRRRALAPNLFGEGLASLGGLLYQLTWTTKLGYVYDEASFKPLRTFNYATEGWGLTQDGTNLIRSDGSSTLTFHKPGSFEVVRQLKVTAGGKPVDNLNELEYVKGAILANIWLTDRVARIDPQSGQVTAWYDLSKLSASIPGRGSDDVPNGIAYDAGTGRLFVTGKRWPTLFEVRLPGSSR